jgi:hypothetical protein
MEPNAGSFDIEIVFEEVSFSFHVATYHSEDLGFEASVMNGKNRELTFVMVRSSLGHWILSGDSLPNELTKHAQDIGRAFEAHSKKIK